MSTRHIFIRTAIAAITFSFGLSIVWVIRNAPQQAIADSASEADSLLTAAPDNISYIQPKRYEEAQTANDFAPFWAEFKSAVSKDDKERLYTLTCHNEFTWELNLKLHIELGESGAFRSDYVIRSYDEFAQNYSEIFSALIKRAILNRQPEKVGIGAYKIEWNEGRDKGSYRLMFNQYKDTGYKFMGAEIGLGY